MYIDVLLSAALPRPYTYHVPPPLEREVGLLRRVLVQFGKSRWTSALVVRLHDEAPRLSEVKEVAQVLDASPVVREGQMELWRWVAGYYLCTLGEVLKAALPSGLKLDSETTLQATSSDCAPRSAQEAAVMEYVREHPGCTAREAGASAGVLRRLIEADVVCVSEELRDGWRPRRRELVSLGREWRSCEALEGLMRELSGRAPRQLEALLGVVQRLGGLERAVEGGECARTAGLGPLVDKGVLASRSAEVSRLPDLDVPPRPPAKLTEAQQTALDETHRAWADGKPALLHGVTGSGKTEIYIHLIAECLNEGRSVLYMLPEIALTTQMTERLARHFGGRMLVYHSKFSDGARCEVWQRLLSAREATLIVGVRSAVLLPLPPLGLIVVDEEHEPSYKQSDPSPRYHARDVAVVLWRGTPGCHIVLGSATPSLESLHNALTGKYRLVRLTERHGGTPLPRPTVVDMTQARREKAVHGGIFSRQLREGIERALGERRQVILFQNRRGFAPILECRECAWTPRCANCDVGMTYHKSQGSLVCHYCGATRAVPPRCPECGSPDVRPQGWGTERLEEVTQALFPEARLLRLDADTARARASFESIIGQFARHEADILIGTQMLSKGLDFADVALVGVANADALLRMPHFRADERSYQLLEQVSGRCGRRRSQGSVIVQTAAPEHPVLQALATHDYDGLARRLLNERQAYHFPPDTRLVNITIKHRDRRTCLDAARGLATDLRARYPDDAKGPVAPLVPRVANLYLQELTLRLTAEPAAMKATLLDLVESLREQPRFKGIVARLDVDPL